MYIFVLGSDNAVCSLKGSVNFSFYGGTQATRVSVNVSLQAERIQWSLKKINAKNFRRCSLRNFIVSIMFIYDV